MSFTIHVDVEHPWFTGYAATTWTTCTRAAVRKDVVGELWPSIGRFLTMTLESIETGESIFTCIRNHKFTGTISYQKHVIYQHHIALPKCAQQPKFDGHEWRSHWWRPWDTSRDDSAVWDHGSQIKCFDNKPHTQYYIDTHTGQDVSFL